MEADITIEVNLKSIEELTLKIEEESLRFLRDKGYENPVRVRGLELLDYEKQDDAKKGEAYDFEVDGMKLNLAYVINKGRCFYSTLPVNESY